MRGHLPEFTQLVSGRARVGPGRADQQEARVSREQGGGRGGTRMQSGGVAV